MRSYRGTLLWAFTAEHKKIHNSPLLRHTAWSVYRCSDCAAFTAYIRWTEFTVTLANIDARGRKKDRAGRMPIILSTLEDMFDTVTVEQVLNENLAAYLRSRSGYVEIPCPGGGTFIWNKRT